MKLVVISPDGDDPREHAVLDELFAAGLERYHVRKPAWPREKLAAWLRALSDAVRARVVLHQHHDLVAPLGLGGRHWRDDGSAPLAPARDGKYTSCSCHDLATVRAALGRYDSVFLSPVFPSISKSGYAPRADFPFAEISSLLAARSADARRTRVLALGGITAVTAPRALALGFDGVAVLGAVWQAADPVQTFTEIQHTLFWHAA